MKEIIFVLIGLGMVVVIGTALARGTEQLENSTGDGTINQQELADSITETIGPADDVTPAPGEDGPDSEDDDPQEGEVIPATLAPGDIED